MSRATLELDFFGKEMMIKQQQQQQQADSNISQFQKFLHRQRSYPSGAGADVTGLFQTAISKINPDLLKSFLSSVSLNGNSNSNNNKSTPPSDHNLPEYPPSAFRPCSENGRETTPMTIFYNGTVTVFDVSSEKAESIMKLATEGSSRLTESEEKNDQKLAVSSSNQEQLLDSLHGDLPIARRKSLQRFLEKRKERLTLPFLIHLPPEKPARKYAFCEPRKVQETSSKL